MHHCFHKISLHVKHNKSGVTLHNTVIWTKISFWLKWADRVLAIRNNKRKRQAKICPASITVCILSHFSIPNLRQWMNSKSPLAVYLQERNSANNYKATSFTSWLILYTTSLKQGHLTSEKVTSGFFCIGRLTLSANREAQKSGLERYKRIWALLPRPPQSVPGILMHRPEQRGKESGAVRSGEFGVSQRTWLNCLLREDREKMKGEDMGVWRRGWGTGDAEWSWESGGWFGVAHTSTKWLLSAPNGHSIAV